MKVKDKKPKAIKYAKDRNYYRMLPMQELVNLVMGGERADELCLVLAERLEEMLEDQDNWVQWQAGHRYENNPED
jgi:hypothetical protein